MTTTRTPRILDVATEQLSLFPSAVPERFRLDDDTRRRGLRHVALLKARLEARYPATPAPVPRPPARLGGRAASDRAA